MTEKKRTPKEIHVDNLIIHAKDVEIISEKSQEQEQPRQRREPFNPWFFGPRRRMEETIEAENVESSVDEHQEDIGNEPTEQQETESTPAPAPEQERRRPFWM